MNTLNTAEQETIFATAFYDLWDQEGFGAPDTNSPYPWGCPWIEDEDLKIEEDAAEHAASFFNLVKDEIAQCIEEAEEYAEQEQD